MKLSYLFNKKYLLQTNEERETAISLIKNIGDRSWKRIQDTFEMNRNSGRQYDTAMILKESEFLLVQIFIRNMGEHITDFINGLIASADRMATKPENYIESLALMHYFLVSLCQKIIAKRENMNINQIKLFHKDLSERLLVIQNGDYIAFMKSQYRIDVAKSIKNGKQVANSYNARKFVPPYTPVASTDSSALYDWRLVKFQNEIKVMHDIYFCLVIKSLV